MSRTTLSRLDQILKPYQHEVAKVYAAMQASGAMHVEGCVAVRTALLLSVLYKCAIDEGGMSCNNAHISLCTFVYGSLYLMLYDYPND